MEIHDRFFTVVNIYSASKKTAKRWRHAKQCLENDGVACDFALTGECGTASELTMQACGDGYRKFLAVGGDGTVHDVLNGIMSFVSSNPGLSSADFTLGVIPMGSGNDWIKSLGISRNIRSAVGIITSGKTILQDVVKVTSSVDCSCNMTSYMVNVGGVGIDAKVCEIVNLRKKNGEHGKMLYIKALIKSIKERVPSVVKVVGDGKVLFEGVCLSIAFGVGKYSGGGLRQTPNAVMDDGLVDVTVIPDMPLGKIAREVYKLFTGGFLTVPGLVASKNRCVEVLSEHDEAAEVDGENVGCSPVRVEVVDEGINVFVP